jgi:hypoxanthine-guanine phosphoribosyltransferase
MKLGQQLSLYTLLKGKIKFQANMGQEFEIPLKVEFGLIPQ